MKLKTQLLKKADEALWRQAKAAAALKGVTLTAWVEKAMTEELKVKSE